MFAVLHNRQYSIGIAVGFRLSERGASNCCSSVATDAADVANRYDAGEMKEDVCNVFKLERCNCRNRPIDSCCFFMFAHRLICRPTLRGVYTVLDVYTVKCVHCVDLVGPTEHCLICKLFGVSIPFHIHCLVCLSLFTLLIYRCLSFYDAVLPLRRILDLNC